MRFSEIHGEPNLVAVVDRVDLPLPVTVVAGHLGQLHSALGRDEHVAVRRGLDLRALRQLPARLDERLRLHQMVLALVGQRQHLADGVRDSTNLEMLEPAIRQQRTGQLPLLGLGQEHRARLHARPQPVLVEQPRGEPVIGQDGGLLPLGKPKRLRRVADAPGELLRGLVRERETEHARRHRPLVLGVEAAGGDEREGDDARRDHGGLAGPGPGHDAARRERVADGVPLLPGGMFTPQGPHDLLRDVRPGKLVGPRVEGGGRHGAAPSSATSPPCGHRGQIVEKLQNWQSASGFGAKDSERIRPRSSEMRSSVVSS